MYALGSTRARVGVAVRHSGHVAEAAGPAARARAASGSPRRASRPRPSPSTVRWRVGRSTRAPTSRAGNVATRARSSASSASRLGGPRSRRSVRRRGARASRHQRDRRRTCCSSTRVIAPRRPRRSQARRCPPSSEGASDATARLDLARANRRGSSGEGSSAISRVRPAAAVGVGRPPPIEARRSLVPRAALLSAAERRGSVLAAASSRRRASGSTVPLAALRSRAEIARAGSAWYSSARRGAEPARRRACRTASKRIRCRDALRASQRARLTRGRRAIATAANPRDVRAGSCATRRAALALLRRAPRVCERMTLKTRCRSVAAHTCTCFPRPPRTRRRASRRDAGCGGEHEDAHRGDLPPSSSARRRVRRGRKAGIDRPAERRDTHERVGICNRPIAACGPHDADAMRTTAPVPRAGVATSRRRRSSLRRRGDPTGARSEDAPRRSRAAACVVSSSQRRGRLEIRRTAACGTELRRLPRLIRTGCPTVDGRMKVSGASKRGDHGHEGGIRRRLICWRVPWAPMARRRRFGRGVAPAATVGRGAGRAGDPRAERRRADVRLRPPAGCDRIETRSASSPRLVRRCRAAGRRTWAPIEPGRVWRGPASSAIVRSWNRRCGDEAAFKGGFSDAPPAERPRQRRPRRPVLRVAASRGAAAPSASSASHALRAPAAITGARACGPRRCVALSPGVGLDKALFPRHLTASVPLPRRRERFRPRRSRRRGFLGARSWRLG